MVVFGAILHKGTAKREKSQIYLNFHSEREQVQVHKVRLMLRVSESRGKVHFYSAEREQVQSHEVRLKVKGEISCQRAKRKTCFSVSQRVQPRFKHTQCD